MGGSHLYGVVIELSVKNEPNDMSQTASKYLLPTVVAIGPSDGLRPSFPDTESVLLMMGAAHPTRLLDLVEDRLHKGAAVQFGFTLHTVDVASHLDGHVRFDAANLFTTRVVADLSLCLPVPIGPLLHISLRSNMGRATHAGVEVFFTCAIRFGSRLRRSPHDSVRLG